MKRILIFFLIFLTINIKTSDWQNYIEMHKKGDYYYDNYTNKKIIDEVESQDLLEESIQFYFLALKSIINIYKKNSKENDTYIQIIKLINLISKNIEQLNCQQFKMNLLIEQDLLIGLFNSIVYDYMED